MSIKIARERSLAMSKEELLAEVRSARSGWIQGKDAAISKNVIASLERLALLGVQLKEIGPAKGGWRERELIVAIQQVDNMSTTGAIERLTALGAISWESHPNRVGGGFRGRQDSERRTSFEPRGCSLSARGEHALLVDGEARPLIEVDAFVVARRIFKEIGSGYGIERSAEIKLLWSFAQGHSTVEQSVLAGIALAMEANRLQCLAWPRPIKAAVIEKALSSALALPLGAQAAAHASSEVTRLRREIEARSVGMEQWFGALLGAIAVDGEDVARVIINEMIKNPVALHGLVWNRSMLDGDFSEKSGEPPFGIVRLALRRGAVKCSRLLLDAGAPLLLFLDNGDKLFPSSNPFALLSKRVAKGQEEAVALCEAIHPVMVKELCAQGLSPERAMKVAHQSLEAAGKGLRLGKSKSAIEKLALGIAAPSASRVGSAGAKRALRI